MATTTDFAVFIDDDEEPEEYWLDELLAVQAKYDADVVAGPVLPRLDAGAPHWARSGAFFDRPRYATGKELPVAGTGNVLVRVEALQDRSGPFDERFALTGGEDYFLFRSLAATGRRIVWADDAKVHEWIPASRATVRWLVRRAHRGMSNFVQFELESRGSMAARAGMVVHGLRLIGESLVLLPLAASLSFRDHGARVVETFQRAARGTGAIAAVLGRQYEEYRDRG